MKKQDLMTAAGRLSFKEIGRLDAFEPSNHEWYALQIRPRFEKVASVCLRDKGYEEYVPTYTSKRCWSDRIKTIELPIFPGYIFCKFEVQNRASHSGTRSVVYCGNGKIPEPSLRRKSPPFRRSSLPDRPAPWPFVHAGERVSVERGPLAGLEGIVIEANQTCV
jgi:transcription antitermination factor NusG